VKKSQDSIATDKLKGVLVTRTAIKTLVPEDIVEKVIMFQFKDVRDAMIEHEQIEISGFGKFMISPNKLRKKIEKLEGALKGMELKIRERPHEIPANRLAVWDKMTQNTENILAYMKTKKGGYENKS
jgi:nucleoid DNA-binding protein